MFTHLHVKISNLKYAYLFISCRILENFIKVESIVMVKTQNEQGIWRNKPKTSQLNMKRYVQAIPYLLNNPQ